MEILDETSKLCGCMETRILNVVNRIEPGCTMIMRTKKVEGVCCRDWGGIFVFESIAFGGVLDGGMYPPVGVCSGLWLRQMECVFSIVPEEMSVVLHFSNESKWGGVKIAAVGVLSVNTGKTLRYKSRNKGWTSADRSTKATLMLTVPSSG